MRSFARQAWNNLQGCINRIGPADCDHCNSAGAASLHPLPVYDARTCWVPCRLRARVRARANAPRRREIGWPIPAASVPDAACGHHVSSDHASGSRCRQRAAPRSQEPRQGDAGGEGGAACQQTRPANSPSKPLAGADRWGCPLLAPKGPAERGYPAAGGTTEPADGARSVGLGRPEAPAWRNGRR
jgi:hypothetical protein